VRPWIQSDFAQQVCITRVGTKRLNPGLDAEPRQVGDRGRLRHAARPRAVWTSPGWARIPSGSMSDEEIEQGPDAVAERLRVLTNELESLASDRGLISALSPAERTRLLNAAGDLYEPDVVRRRESGKAARRRAKASIG